MKRNRLFGLLLLCACGPGETEVASTDSSASTGQQAAAAQAEIEPRPEGVYRLIVRDQRLDNAPAPDGYRILRMPPRIEDFPPGAQVDRREVQKGIWRPYPGEGQPLVIDLKPTPEALKDRWMLVAYAQNSLHDFRYADNAFRRVELGTSPQFELDPLGGERELMVEIEAPLQVQPSFDAPSEVQGPYRFEFSYGPIAAAPRVVRGDWSGEGPLPFLVSRYALGREGYLSLFQSGWPSEATLGPVEFELGEGITQAQMPRPIPSGPLLLMVAPRAQEEGGEVEVPWVDAEVLGSYRNAENRWSFRELGVTRADGSVELERVQAGRYRLSARHPDGRILLGWIPFDGEPLHSAISAPPIPETGTLALTDLPQADDWQVEVWSFWGGLLVGRTRGAPGAAITLPHLGEMRHQALATRFSPDRGDTLAYLFLECEWHEGAWLFHAAPTEFSIQNFTDDLGLVLRLYLTDDAEPQQNFPPALWQIEAGKPEALDYFPVPFRGGLDMHGLPEGQYEAGIWGIEPSTGRVAELATFWPVSEAVIED
jgi:hypothetical protein